METARPLGPIINLPPALLPSAKTVLSGRTILLEKLDLKHANDLFPLIGGDEPTHTSLWDYMGDGPFPSLHGFRDAIASKSASKDPFYLAAIDQREDAPSKGKAIGYLSLMRITPDQLAIEVGNVMFSPTLQRTTGATEAIYLLARHAFQDLGYRRLEWKCHALNAGSQRAARRLGFTFEGVFRHHMVVKGRNRDTTWFSLLRDEWEGGVKEAFEKWLNEENFDEHDKQKRSLQEFRERKKVDY
ncbi:hypothetical protein AOCH_002524 [Aspergillus ochraceoroseus]|uniref:N-acetyltransferase domain-containing protein n=1 Tax=Aspergillus ochraceoroseus TaxID=138278 RepID=A0A0F8VA49_9EURO|nr:hypothetical protein AOCH_002524 [Aspergillus ochraceoroseus]